ncbi:MAG: signal peptidase I [Oscillospiraceae bacterium]|nr:signal peptidase I [Oscillospiraceae bacterium]MBQ6802205.1 signal peptidase I [Oscillospiraceae bacterium]
MKNKLERTAVPSTAEAEGEITVVEEESKGKRILNTIVNVVLVVAIALAAVCTYVSYVSTSGNGVPNIFGIRMFSIQTESMYPTLLPGDLIFDVGVKDPGELRRDDIITYWTVINGERVLNTHRIYEIYDGGGYLIFSTKGDNNTSADPLTVHESEIVGKYSFRVPGVGKVFDYLQTSTGFLIVIVIPVFLFFLFHLVQFFRVLFEYQNVKNRIKFEQERGRTEDLIEEQQKKQQQQIDAAAEARAKMEAEIRERLRAEILASMAAQQQAQPAPAEQPAPAPVEAEAEPAVTVEETSVTEETALEEVPAAEEPAPAEEPAEEAVLEAEEALEEEEASEKEETPAEEKAEDKTEETAEV